MKIAKGVKIFGWVVVGVIVGTGVFMNLTGKSFVGPSKAPDCNSTDVKTTLIKLVSEQALKGEEADVRSGAILPEALEKFKRVTYELVNVRNSSFDSSVGSYTCAADMKATVPKDICVQEPCFHITPLAYKVELSDGGKNFIVTLLN